MPLAAIVRQTPDGKLWALQQRVVAGRPASLDFARWQGDPTQMTLGRDGARLKGTVSFHGKPVHGLSPTLEGRGVKAEVYIDCFGCPGHRHGWMSMLGVAPKADGSFAVYLRPSWTGKRYRATIAGGNFGWALAPDAQVFFTQP